MVINNERINEAKLWLQRANADFKMANLAYINSLYPEAVYHAQQTTEKALKTVLAIFGEELQAHKVTTYFDDLVNLKYDFDFDTVINNSLELERHWLSSKYPIKRRDGKIINPDDLYTKEKTKKLIGKSKYVLENVQKFLKEEFDLVL